MSDVPLEVVTVNEIETVVVTEEGDDLIVTVFTPGPQGPAGDTDLLAPVAFSGSYADLSNKPLPDSFSQTFTGTNTVVCNHNLGKYPSITIIDSAGEEVEGEPQYTSINSLTINFSAPHSGVVFLN